MSDPIKLLEETYDWTDQVLSGLGQEQMSAPTPCADWDVRQLVNHLIGATAMFTVVVRGDTPEADETPSDPVGADPRAAFAKVVTENLAAWREPGALERTVKFSIGDIPATTAAGFNLQEVLAHAWDIAKATGQDTALPPEAAEAALAFAMGAIKPEYRGPNAPIGPAVSVDSEAPVQDRFVAFLGRRP